MNNENRDAATNRSPVLTGAEPVESIEELLRKRGFFDPIKPEEKA